MTLKKRASKSIALALVGLIVGTSIFSQVSAMEYHNDYDNEVIEDSEILSTFNMTEEDVVKAKEEREKFSNDTEESERFSNKQVNLIKIEFQQKYGTEDKFIFVEEYKNVKSEVNGARGIVRITDLNTGTIDTINYFDTLDELNNEYDDSNKEEEGLSVRATPSRPKAWKTQGPDKANLSVTKGTSRDTIKAYNPVTGTVKTYTKDTTNWYSGYTKGYYDNVQEARKCIGTAKSKAGSAGEAALIATASNYVKSKNWYPKESTFLAAFRAIAAGNAIYDGVNAAKYGVLYLGHMGIVYNNYLKL